MQLAICSICMDVNDAIEKSLPSWIRRGGTSPIIITDWCSKVPVWDTVIHVVPRDQLYRIFVVRAIDKEIFYITKARNLAMKLMRQEINPLPKYTLMIDADILLRKNITLGELGDNGFLIAGRGHRSGTALFPTQGFWDVNGYIESITMGYSEWNFYNRLRQKQYHKKTKEDNSSLSLVRHIGCKPNTKRIGEKQTSKVPWRVSNRWMNSGVMEQIDVEIYRPDGEIVKQIL